MKFLKQKTNKQKLKEMNKVTTEMGTLTEQAFQKLGKIKAICDKSMFGMVATRVIKEILKNG